MPEERTKICSRCKQELPLSAFPWIKERRTDNGGLNNRAGYDKRCLECRNRAARESYRRNRGLGLPIWAQWRQRSAQARRNQST